MGEVYKAIAAVMADMGEKGISKNRKNAQQGYAYRGIEDVLKVLNESLCNNGLVIIPEVLDRETLPMKTKSGGDCFYTRIRMAFNLICVSDGSLFQAITYGEAMDTGDKSHNKAMSVAYKYMAFQTFCIPTEGLQHDTEEFSHEIVIETPKPVAPVAVTSPPPKQLLDDPIADAIGILAGNLHQTCQALNIDNLKAKNLYFKQKGSQQPKGTGQPMLDYLSGLLAYLVDVQNRFNGVGGQLNATEREFLGLPL
jgi:hypothetical protein